MKIVSKHTLLVTLITLLAFLPHSSCSWGGPDYTLTVIVGEGVEGTPESGTYVLKEFSEVEYDYEPVAGAVIPDIYLNTYRRTVLVGTLVLYSDTVMTVEQIDMRGEWTLTYKESDGDAGEDTTITFEGTDLLGGTFTDSRGYSGTWSITEFTRFSFVYENWADYVFSGVLPEFDGQYTGEGTSGTWSMTRTN